MKVLYTVLAPPALLIATASSSLSSYSSPSSSSSFSFSSFLPRHHLSAVVSAFALPPPPNRRHGSVKTRCRFASDDAAPIFASADEDLELPGGDDDDGDASSSSTTSDLSDPSVLPAVTAVAAAPGCDDTAFEEGDGDRNTSFVDFPGGSSSGPFSMTFRRYRVDFSRDDDDDRRSSRDAKKVIKEEDTKRRKRRTERGILAPRSYGKKTSMSSDKEGEFFGGNIFGGIGAAIWDSYGARLKSAADRMEVEAAYAAESKGTGGRYTFRWATVATGPRGEGFRGTAVGGGGSDGDDSRPYVDEDLVAAAAFWRTASDAVAETLDVANNRRTRAEERWMLALPETTPSVVRRLCDIANWLADQQEEKGRDTAVERGSVILRAYTYDRTSVPVVIFTAETTTTAQTSRHLTASAMPAETEARTKAWVRRVLVKLKVCPFTKSDAKSGQGLTDLGVPVANIMYRHSDADRTSSGIYALMADSWEAISDMIALGPSGRNGVSSILLSAPGYDDDFDLWAGPVFAMLEAGVGAVQAEAMVGVVCFHPKYATPDGKSWPGFGHMHSLPRLRKWLAERIPEISSQLSDADVAAGGAWQRRTPHAVINVLRADQLEVAEGRRATGELYARNVSVLVAKDGGVGSIRLAEDLEREQLMSFSK